MVGPSVSEHCFAGNHTSFKSCRALVVWARPPERNEEAPEFWSQFNKRAVYELAQKDGEPRPKCRRKRREICEMTRGSKRKTEKIDHPQGHVTSCSTFGFCGPPTPAALGTAGTTNTRNSKNGGPADNMFPGYCATAGTVLRRFERERRPDEFPKDDPLRNQRRSPVEVAATAPRHSLSHATVEVPPRRTLPVQNLGNGAMFRRAGGRWGVYKLEFSTSLVSVLYSRYLWHILSPKRFLNASAQSVHNASYYANLAISVLIVQSTSNLYRISTGRNHANLTSTQLTLANSTTNYARIRSVECRDEDETVARASFNYLTRLTLTSL
ncbi:hypothetical protein R3P38DRAFT_3526252 [Favolaschia claudopus]|uniref:Uncharacterized protein n=1 Tax=Favolaschia claudopus TaxID=2862362 RepID=A0AAW0BKT2_9AGAR